MKSGDLFSAKIGAVSVVLAETAGNPKERRWVIEHFERTRIGVRGVAFYGQTQTEVMEKLINSKRSLPKDADIKFEHRTIGGDAA
jgi:hypothetical protein